jgi:glycosyltransferase involved in cell wall biosynthesis
VVERPAGGEITPDQVTRRRELFVQGWAVSTRREELRIRARLGEGAWAECRPRHFRDDVASAHPDLIHAGQSGFGLLVPMPGDAKEAKLVVEARSPSTSSLLEDRLLRLPGGHEFGFGEAPVSDERPAARKRARAQNRPARLLFVSHNFNLEGAPRSLLELATNLDPRRFSARVVSPASGPLEGAWSGSGIPAESACIAYRADTVDDHEASVRRIAALQSRHRPELLVANTLDGFWCVDLARELGIPSIWIIRESVDPAAQLHERWPVAVAERALDALARASRVVFVSRATEELYRGYLPAGKSCVIHNGLDLPEFDRAIARRSIERTRRKLDLPGQRPVLLCVGTTCQRKGQLVLLEALAQLRRRRPASPRPCAVFLGVQPGPYLDAMRAAMERLELAEQVRLVDPTPDPLPYYRSADLALCPSFQESLPRVVLEAMAAELPVVASRIHGIPELVRDGREGLLCAPGDVQALAEAIGVLLDRPDRAAHLGAAGRRRAEEHFTLDRMVEGYQACFAELLSPGASDRVRG